MKLVLAAKSLLLKGINITMKCLLITLIAAFALPTAIKADNAFDSIVDKLDNTDF